MIRLAAVAWLLFAPACRAGETDVEVDDEPIPCPEGTVAVRDGSRRWRCGDRPALKRKEMPGTERTELDEDCPAGLYLAQNYAEPCFPVFCVAVKPLKPPEKKCPKGTHLHPFSGFDPLHPWKCFNAYSAGPAPNGICDACIFPDHAPKDGEEPVEGLRVRKLSKPGARVKATKSRPAGADLVPPKCPPGTTPRKNPDRFKPWICVGEKDAGMGQ